MYFYILIGVILPVTLLLSSCKEEKTYSPYQTSIVEDRHLKDEDFKLDPESPIPTSIRSNFKGLHYFEPDSTWQIKAKLVGIHTHEFMRRNALDSTRLYKAFHLKFSRQGRAMQLTAFWNDSTHKSLFIPFRDATTGNLSYGGGRFLDIPISIMMPDSSIMLDFNRSYNPYCAYNPEYSCPIPPQENTLPFAVKAGEKVFEEHP